MLTLRQLIPPLTARTPAGQTVRAWDYKQKKSLLIAFLHAECPLCQALAERLASRRGELIEHESVALLVSLGPPRWGVATTPRLVLASDTNGRAALQYLGEDALGSTGLAQVGIFVADRYGELFAQWQAREADKLAPVAEMFKWLAYTQLVCGECSAPQWPAGS